MRNVMRTTIASAMGNTDYINIHDMHEFQKHTYSREKSQAQLKECLAEIEEIEGRIKEREAIAPEELTIEDMQQNIIDHKARVEAQKKVILFNIEEMEHEGISTRIKGEKVNSFAIADIEEQTHRLLTTEAFERKINALKQAYTLSIYSDQRLMDAIRTYLTAIRPEIEKADSCQWELIAQMRKLQQEHRQEMGNLMQQYRDTQERMAALLKAGDVSINKPGYDKMVKPGSAWINQVRDVTELVDRMLQSERFDIARTY